MAFRSGHGAIDEVQHSNGHCARRARIGCGAGSGVANRTGRASAYTRCPRYPNADVVPASHPTGRAEDERLAPLGAYRLANAAQGPDRARPAAKRQQTENARRLKLLGQQLPVDHAQALGQGDGNGADDLGGNPRRFVEHLFQGVLAQVQQHAIRGRHTTG